MRALLILAILMLSATASAKDHQRTKIVCLGGYQYVIVTNGYGGGATVAIVQSFKAGAFYSSPPQPIMCK